MEDNQNENENEIIILSSIHIDNLLKWYDSLSQENQNEISSNHETIDHYLGLEYLNEEFFSENQKFFSFKLINKEKWDLAIKNHYFLLNKFHVDEKNNEFSNLKYELPNFENQNLNQITE